MKLRRLPARVSPISTNRIATLATKAGTTERIRGDAGMKIRRRALLAGGFACVDCGRISTTNEIDHEIPLEQGGSNDDANLRIRCIECHKAKTKREAEARAGR